MNFSYQIQRKYQKHFFMVTFPPGLPPFPSDSRARFTIGSSHLHTHDISNRIHSRIWFIPGCRSNSTFDAVSPFLVKFWP